VIKLFRDFFADTVNFVHRQVLQISALRILLREILFIYGAVEKFLCQTRMSTKFLLTRFAKNEQRISATLVWTMRICKAEPAKKRTAHRGRELLTGTTNNYSCTTHQRKRNAAPQAMHTAIKKLIKKLRLKAGLSGQSETTTSTICLLIASQSRPQ
jgi:hypothetical protein